MASDELVAWLRGVIEGRLALARHLISVQAEVESGVVTVPAGHPPASPRWREPSSGLLWTGEGSDGDIWHGTWAMGDSRLTRFIADNDPETVIARCEAELAVLDEHAARNGYGLALVMHGKPGDDCVRICKACSAPYPCRTVRLAGWGYRHRPGYREEWRS